MTPCWSDVHIQKTAWLYHHIAADVNGVYMYAELGDNMNAV